MDVFYKRIVAVLALSMLLPRLIINLGIRLRGLPDQETTEPSSVLESAVLTKPTLIIPVLMDEDLVVQMDLEEYVRGVVLSEMPASFGEEALKAQAVAARTYSLLRLQRRDKHPDGAVCIHATCCQSWVSDEEYLQQRGSVDDWKKVSDAVKETAGQVVTFEGKLAETTYFSCSGGKTEAAVAVWNTDIPYLQAVDSPGEEWASVFSHQIHYTKEEFAACLGRNLTGEPNSWFGKVSRTKGNGVAVMAVGGISYSGVQLRKLLGLPSTAFTMTADEKGITITSRGYGHRVGMSQYGAAAMASGGSNYMQILQHYYPGTKIDKIGDL